MPKSPVLSSKSSVLVLMKSLEDLKLERAWLVKIECSEWARKLHTIIKLSLKEMRKLEPGFATKKAAFLECKSEVLTLLNGSGSCEHPILKEKINFLRAEIWAGELLFCKDEINVEEKIRRIFDHLAPHETIINYFSNYLELISGIVEWSTLNEEDFSFELVQRMYEENKLLFEYFTNGEQYKDKYNNHTKEILTFALLQVFFLFHSEKMNPSSWPYFLETYQKLVVLRPDLESKSVMCELKLSIDQLRAGLPKIIHKVRDARDIEQCIVRDVVDSYKDLAGFLSQKVSHVARLASVKERNNYIKNNINSARGLFQEASELLNSKERDANFYGLILVEDNGFLIDVRTLLNWHANNIVIWLRLLKFVFNIGDEGCDINSMIDEVLSMAIYLDVLEGVNKSIFASNSLEVQDVLYSFLFNCNLRVSEDNYQRLFFTFMHSWGNYKDKLKLEMESLLEVEFLELFNKILTNLLSIHYITTRRFVELQPLCAWLVDNEKHLVAASGFEKVKEFHCRGQAVQVDVNELLRRIAPEETFKDKSKGVRERGMIKKIASLGKRKKLKTKEKNASVVIENAVVNETAIDPIQIDPVTLDLALVKQSTSTAMITETLSSNISWRPRSTSVDSTQYSGIVTGRPLFRPERSQGYQMVANREQESNGYRFLGPKK